MNNSIITPKLKDELLQQLCDELRYEYLYRLDKSSVKLSDERITPVEIHAMFSQFHRMGLISDYSQNSCSYSVCLLLEASDFLSRGGFYAQEELLKNNIEKLGKELQLLTEELKPNHLEKANTIASLTSAILGAITFFRP